MLDMALVHKHIDGLPICISLFSLFCFFFFFFFQLTLLITNAHKERGAAAAAKLHTL